MKTPSEDHELEAELRRLQPCRPSELLATRVEQAIGGEQAAGRRRRWLLGLAAVAALTAVLVPLFSRLLRESPELAGHRADGDPKGLSAAHEPGVTNQDRVLPAVDPGLADQPEVASELAGYTRLGEANYLYAAEDDGIVFASTTTPLRRIRYQYLDTTDWRDEQAQAVIRVVVPREDVVLVPLYVY